MAARAHERYNDSELIRVVALEDIHEGDLVIPVSMFGNTMAVQRADCRKNELTWGPMFVANMDCDGVRVGRPVTQEHHMNVVQWRTCIRRIDTTGMKLRQPVYLGIEGKISKVPTRRAVGIVLRLGPETKEPAGEPSAGAVLLHPGTAYQPS